MRSFRSRPVGWRYESHRHMLAAKGIGSKSSHVVMYPIDVAFEMRKKGSYSGSMNAKRGEGYLNRLEKSMRQKGFIEPIPAEEHEIAEGRLQEGKHRLIVAKRIGLKEVPVEISPDRGSLRATWESRHPDEAYVSPLKRKFMSNKYFMPFVKKTTIPAVDWPEDYRSFTNVTVSAVSPEVAEAKIRSTWKDDGKNESFEKNTYPPRVQKLIKAHHKGYAITPPVIYYKQTEKGLEPTAFDNSDQVQAAKELGLSEIPLVEAVERKFIPDKKQFMKGEFVYSPFEKAEMERERREIQMAGGLTIDHPAEGVNVIRPATEMGEKVRPAAKDVSYIDTIPKKFNKKDDQKFYWERPGDDKQVDEKEYMSKKQDYNINYHKSTSNKYDFKEVGVDAKGRRVRKYDEAHWKVADKEKYLRAAKLKHEMPKVMKQLQHDAFSGDDEIKKNARAVLVIAKTGMRPGTRKDMKADQKSYGVTTLKKSHVQTSGSEVKFNFTGKHGINIKQTVKDPTLAKVVKAQKHDSKSAELFPHTSDATLRNYLYKTTDYKPKDFRTVKANHIAEKLVKAGVSKEKVTEVVAQQLANTPKVSENSYIDPKVWK
jgi:DNA topoisomerase-1